MSWTFAHPERIHLLWGVLLFVAFLAWRDRRGADALGRFVSRVMQDRLARHLSKERRWLRLALIGCTLALAVLALMRPQTSRPTRVASGKVSADVMVVLDVSKSMLADDAAPTRLDRAKAEVRDLLGELKDSRFGLVAFAGRASVLCPLTADHGFFRLVLENAAPASVTRGGTRIGDGVRAAVEAFPPGLGAKIILLITDGEDHDSYPVEAAREAARAGVRIIAIGFGSEEGSPIQLVDPKTGAKETLKDRGGNVVVSRLDGKTLREIALATEGVYVPAGTAVLDLESIVEEHIDPLMEGPGQVATRMARAERYQWFVMGALVALVGAVASGRPEPRSKT